MARKLHYGISFCFFGMLITVFVFAYIMYRNIGTERKREKSHKELLSQNLRKMEYLRWKPTGKCFVYYHWGKGDFDPIPCEDAPADLLIDLGPEIDLE